MVFGQNKRIVWVFPILLSALSCTEPPPLKLTSAQRDQLDTLYNQEILTLAPRMDSLCEAMVAQELTAAVDSILAARKEATRKLREKYRKE